MCFKGIGKDSETVVAASACLDDGCMQMAQTLEVQKKSDIVEESIMIQIIRVRVIVHNVLVLVVVCTLTAKIPFR